MKIFCDVGHTVQWSEMGIIESIVLGIVQGLTEFIPVSSSGHLVVTQAFFGGTSDHLFVEYLDLGTLAALIIYFWSRLMELAREVLVQHNFRLLRNIIVAAIPVGVLGLALSSVIEGSSLLALPIVVATGMIMVGIVMVVLEKLPMLSRVETSEGLPVKRSFTIGLAQSLALIPGVSRSGSTIIAGRLMGLSPAKAAEFSFLVSIPVMLGLVAKLLLKHSDRAYLLHNLQPIIISNIAAFITGLLAIGFLMRYLAKHPLTIFGWYRIGAGLIVVALVGFGTLR